MSGKPSHLQVLRTHHQDGREQARRLAEATRRDAPARQAAALAFLEYFDGQVVPHMRAEERSLLPLLLSDDPRVVRILREHERLYVLARRLREALAEGPPPAQDLLRISVLLQGHIALEERELYPEAAERLPTRRLGPAEGLWWPAPESGPA